MPASSHRVVVYINGFRVDPVAVTVASRRDAFVTFSVSVPGIPEWDVLPPRSHVVVFYRDAVTRAWRLLVEGEFIGMTRTKTAEGQRLVELLCQSLFGVLSYATHISVVGAGNRPLTETGPATVVTKSLELVFNGRRISASGTPVPFMSIQQILDTILASTGPLSVYKILTLFVRYLLSVMPVEAFYMHERFLVEKMYAIADAEIIKLLPARRLQDFLRGSAFQALSDHATLEEILKYIESLMMYQHISVVAPPLYSANRLAPRDGAPPPDTYACIPELLFTPYLYDVVPPACNVIFQDQIRSIVRSRDYIAEPTRVITKLTSPVGANLPMIYVANSVEESRTIGELVDRYEGVLPGNAATHEFLSVDELHRGVISRVVPIGFDTLVLANRGELSPGSVGSTTSSLDYFWDSATRHLYREKTAEFRRASLTCAFLPMLVPGMPCLVEDYSGPFHGYIESVTHFLTNSSAPQTSVEISHAYPAYIIEGRSRTPPLPSWLNAAFRPNAIAGIKRGAARAEADAVGTWAKILGRNAFDIAFNEPAFSAAIPDQRITADIVYDKPVSAVNASDPPNFDTQQVNMDILAGMVFPVLKFTADLSPAGKTSGTLAERFRGQADPLRAMECYNWRPGVTLAQYVVFHRLSIAGQSSLSATRANDLDVVDEPPAMLFEFRETSTDDVPKMFAAPMRMRYTGKDPIDRELRVSVSNTTYGGYELERVDHKLLDMRRIRAMQAIVAGLGRVVTRS